MSDGPLSKPTLCGLVLVARELVVDRPGTPVPGRPDGLCQDWCVVFETLVRACGREPTFRYGFLGPYDHSWAIVDGWHCDGTGDQREGLFIPPVFVARRMPYYKDRISWPTSDMCPRSSHGALRSRARRWLRRQEATLRWTA